MIRSSADGDEVKSQHSADEYLIDDLIDGPFSERRLAMWLVRQLINLAKP